MGFFRPSCSMTRAATFACNASVSDPAVRVTDLVVRYGSRAAVDGLSFEAAQGAVTALVGVLAWLKVRPDLAEAASGGFFWIKAGYTAALGLGGFLAAERLSRPAASPSTSST